MRYSGDAFFRDPSSFRFVPLPTPMQALQKMTVLTEVDCGSKCGKLTCSLVRSFAGGLLAVCLLVFAAVEQAAGEAIVAEGSLAGGIVQDGILNWHVLANVNAADTTNSDQLWSGGGLGLTLTGSGVTVGLWDGGDVRATHVELVGNVTVIDSVGLSSHATHVAGTIAAKGISPTRRGMASGVQIRSRDFNNDTAEMTIDAGLIDLSNHSYGFARGWAGQLLNTPDGLRELWFGNYSVSGTEDNGFGNYGVESSTIDGIIHANPHLLSIWASSTTATIRFPMPGVMVALWASLLRLPVRFITISVAAFMSSAMRPATQCRRRTATVRTVTIRFPTEGKPPRTFW